MFNVWVNQIVVKLAGGPITLSVNNGAHPWTNPMIWSQYVTILVARGLTEVNHQ